MELTKSRQSQLLSSHVHIWNPTRLFANRDVSLGRSNPNTTGGISGMYSSPYGCWSRYPHQLKRIQQLILSVAHNSIIITSTSEWRNESEMRRRYQNHLGNCSYLVNKYFLLQCFNIINFPYKCVTSTLLI